MTHPTAKCVRCKATARVEVARANAAFCSECFIRFVRGQVQRAIEERRMFARAERLLVCVSGGKDSLALWDILAEEGYDTTGYHVVLWTGDAYARESRERCEEFAARRGLPLIVTDLEQQEGFTVERIAREGSRAPCSVCGLAKRYLTNFEAVRGDFDVVVTGHNLDDEAATLLGNTLHWDAEYLARQTPVLPETHPKLKRKVKPLYRVAERETAAYAVLRGIDYIIDECPLVAGNTALRYKNALNELERSSPGTKQQFLFGFIERAAASFTRGEPVELHECVRCGMPTPGDVCAFCRAKARLKDGTVRHGRRHHRGSASVRPRAAERLEVAAEGIIPARDGP